MKKIFLLLIKYLPVIQMAGFLFNKSILNEMMNNLITAKAKEYPNISKGLVIGDGKIKMDIPIFDKSIVLDAKDIEEFKNSFKQ